MAAVAALMASMPAKPGLGLLRRLVGGASRRLRPLISLRVEFFSRYESVSDVSDSERDQRLWHEIRGTLPLWTVDWSPWPSASASAPASVE